MADYTKLQEAARRMELFLIGMFELQEGFGVKVALPDGGLELHSFQHTAPGSKGGTPAIGKLDFGELRDGALLLHSLLTSGKSFCRKSKKWQAMGNLGEIALRLTTAL
ncbi:MAG: hypothetical protein FWG30_01060 [Eubacteriaceae bacterium]|nr:hypothetical protein [Eubacteriaceae bacterium]